MSDAIGNLFVIAAPSGAGKTSLVQALVDRDPRLQLSISHTTRSPRPGEVDAEHYHFTDAAQFAELIARDRLLEHAQVHGNFYGTARDQIEAAFASGSDVILEIDWQGAQQVKRLMPRTQAIFILPPSRATLKQRLTARGQDDSAIIAARMAQAVEEMSHYVEGDYLVVNQDFDTALAELQAIISCQRLRTSRQQVELAELLQDLLS